MEFRFPAGMLVGYELEFCTQRQLRHGEVDHLKPWFVLGTDGSLNPQRDPDSPQYELRSAEPMRVFSVEVLDLALSHLRALNAGIFTTRTCGLHVHASWDIPSASRLFANLMENVVPKAKPFPERESYCDPHLNSYRGPRYGALRWVNIAGGHFEIRSFNGTMKLRGITHAMKLVHNEALRVAAGSQAPKTQSAGLGGLEVHRGDLWSRCPG